MSDVFSAAKISKWTTIIGIGAIANLMLIFLALNSGGSALMFLAPHFYLFYLVLSALCIPLFVANLLFLVNIFKAPGLSKSFLRSTIVSLVGGLSFFAHTRLIQHLGR